MTRAIAIFFASLISGALSLADFRPAASDIVQILTGVELAPQESAAAPASDNQQVYGTPDKRPDKNSCNRVLLTQTGKQHKPACCQAQEQAG